MRSFACLLTICLFFIKLSFAQTISVGTFILEETLRRRQIKDEINDNSSFLIRPINLQNSNYSDSSLSDSLRNVLIARKYALKRNKGCFLLLPITLKQQYNTHHPFGWNDGSMIKAKGYQSQLSMGIYAKLGPMSIQLHPEYVFAQNSNFETFPFNHSDSIWRSYYSIQNRIDDPEKYGNGVYKKLFPGQSSIRFNYKKLSLGISTENLWWGPGVRNALIMSNNAPGFKHITFNTTSPVNSKIGSFEWQVISGILENSGLIPADTTKSFNGQKLYDPKIADDRYLNGLIITWQPKWTKGLYLGFSRVFYQYKNNISSSLNGYLPVVTGFFKSNTQSEEGFGRDQLLSFFARVIMPASKAELYAEYGKNDHSQNLRDLILEPEHARALIIGGRKIFERKAQKELELFFELTHLQMPSTIMVRALPTWYAHHQVRQGYTNKGQVIGAGIGPGGSSQTIGLSWLKDMNKFGVILERIVHNNDFFYDAFAEPQAFERHWVDLAFNLNKSWIKKRIIYSANLSLVRSYNYQWQYNTALDEDVDATNLHATFSVSYLFR